MRVFGPKRLRNSARPHDGAAANPAKPQFNPLDLQGSNTSTAGRNTPHPEPGLQSAAPDGPASWTWFLQRVLAFTGIVSFVYLLWQIREVLLLAFAAVTVAILLLSASDLIKRFTGLAHRWSLTIAGMAILALTALALYLMGAQVRAQIDELAGLLPEALRTFEQQVGVAVPGIGPEQDGAAFSLSSELASRLASWSYAIVDVIASLILVIAGGVFFAADPDVYRRGLVALFPTSQHERADDALLASGRALRLWLLAELIAMSIIGVLAGIGTWLIGLPAPLALGLFAGLTEFVPVVGPILGAVPALLLALTQGTSTFLWTLGLFVAIQQLESNVIAPIIERQMVRIPPGLFLFAVFALWLLFGALGVLIGAPLTVVLYVLVKKLYVRQTLGRDTDLPV